MHRLRHCLQLSVGLYAFKCTPGLPLSGSCHAGVAHRQGPKGHRRRQAEMMSACIAARKSKKGASRSGCPGPLTGGRAHSAVGRPRAWPGAQTAPLPPAQQRTLPAGRGHQRAPPLTLHRPPALAGMPQHSSGHAPRGRARTAAQDGRPAQQTAAAQRARAAWAAAHLGCERVLCCASSSSPTCRCRRGRAALASVHVSRPCCRSVFLLHRLACCLHPHLQWGTRHAAAKRGFNTRGRRSGSTNAALSGCDVCTPPLLPCRLSRTFEASEPMQGLGG